VESQTQGTQQEVGNNRTAAVSGEIKGESMTGKSLMPAGKFSDELGSDAAACRFDDGILKRIRSHLRILFEMFAAVVSTGRKACQHHFKIDQAEPAGDTPRLRPFTTIEHKKGANVRHCLRFQARKLPQIYAFGARHPRNQYAGIAAVEANSRSFKGPFRDEPAGVHYAETDSAGELVPGDLIEGGFLELGDPAVKFR